MRGSHRYFGFESGTPSDARLDLPSRVARCVAHEFARVGLPPAAVDKEVARELSRSFARDAFEELASHGIEIAGKRLIDIGCGLGEVAVEGAVRGARPIAVEPGRGLREVAAARLREVGRGAAMAADAEALPLRDECVDVAVSLQVLEHVVNPRRMLAEAFRVLRPGGFFLLTCENYLSFREPHYRVAWLPLLSKRIGGAYLRLRGRSPEFLYRSVTYVTRPGVIRMLRECGFVLLRQERIDALVRDPAGIRTAWKRRALGAGRRVLAPAHLARLAFAAQEARGLCAVGFCEVLRKPA